MSLKPAPQWKPGQSGNPKGKPKGSRTKLSERFLADLHADWQENGPAVLEQVRAEKPDVYLRVVASILPKQLEVKRPLEDMSDAELADALDAVRSLIGATLVAGDGAGEGDEAPSSGTALN